MDLILKSPTTLEWKGKIYPCRTGKGGILINKVEGDGATPTGPYPLRQLFYRADRLPDLDCKLPMSPMTEQYGWCDDPMDPAYNRFVQLPYPARHEALWRADHVYDIIIVVGHNDSPPIPHKGSAIFIHLMNDKKTPTDGCIALAKDDLLHIMSELSPASQLVVPNNLSKELQA